MGGKKANQRQGRRAAKQASPPAGYHSDKAGRRPPPLRPPPGTQTAGIASAARVQVRGCKGRSPLHKKTISLPLPAGKSALRTRAGGWGRKSNQRQGRRAAKQASPPRVPQRQGRQATTPLRPPPGTQTAGIASAAGVQPGGRREPPAYPPIPPFFAPPLDKTQAYVYNVA